MKPVELEELARIAHGADELDITNRCLRRMEDVIGRLRELHGEDAVQLGHLLPRVKRVDHLAAHYIHVMLPLLVREDIEVIDYSVQH